MWARFDAYLNSSKFSLDFNNTDLGEPYMPTLSHSGNILFIACKILANSSVFIINASPSAKTLFLYFYNIFFLNVNLQLFLQ